MRENQDFVFENVELDVALRYHDADNKQLIVHFHLGLRSRSWQDVHILGSICFGDVIGSSFLISFKLPKIPTTVRGCWQHSFTFPLTALPKAL